MAAPIIQSADCCSTCPDIPITQVPGPEGDPGEPGTPGTDGINAFTSTTSGFTMPAVEALVTVDVADSSWMAVGQVIFIENAGYFRVDSIPDGTSVSLLNLGYTGNAAPATVVAGSQAVSPGGIKGTDGAAGSTPTLNSISPTTTRGDLIVDNGAGAGSASDVRLGVGTDGQLVVALSTQPTGLLWRTLLPNAATDNLVPRFDASGVTTPTPLQSSLLRITDNGAIQETGGNAKGTDAVDLQPIRGVATQVASGANATIPGGKNNTASGASSVAIGDTNVSSGATAVSLGAANTSSGAGSTALGSNNTASGPQSAVLGDSNSASGTGSAAIGINNLVDGAAAFALGSSCFAHADNSVALGNGSITSVGADNSLVSGFRSLSVNYGQRSHACGQFGTQGDAQLSDLIWRGSTTDATPTEIFLDGSAARATVPNNTTWAFSILAVARRSTGVSVVFKVEGGIKNIAGVVTLVAAITTTVVSDGSGGALAAGSLVASADDPNNALILTVTGVAAQNWRWVASARLVEVLNA